MRTTAPFLLSITSSLALTLASVADSIPSTFDPSAYTATGSFTLSSTDSVTIDTDLGVIYGDTLLTSSGTITDAQGTSYTLFILNEVSITAGASVSFTGSNGCAILSQGDIVIESDLLFSGTDGLDGTTIAEAGTPGESGGSIALIAEDLLSITGNIYTNGGSGGVGGDGELLGEPGDVTDPGDGGDGGHGGNLILAAPRLHLTGEIHTDGGDGGEIGYALASWYDESEPFSTYGIGGNAGSVWISNDFINMNDHITSLEAGVGNRSSGDAGTLYSLSLESFLLPTIHYVDAAREGETTQDGTTWESAYADLQDALASAIEGDQIWLAAGTYYPDEAESADTTGAVASANSAYSSFTMLDGVYVVGGFSGSESSASERDPDNNLTVLSGDVGHENDPDLNTENGVMLESLHTNLIGTNGGTVVHGATSTDQDILVCGVTITAGYSGENGGGFTGGGTLLNCTIQGNYSVDSGGVYVSDDLSLSIIDSSIIGNSGYFTGGLYAEEANLQVLRSKIQGNTITSSSVYAIGGVYLFQTEASFQNSIISGNMGSTYGGMLVAEFFGSSDDSTIRLEHCAVVANIATTSIGENISVGGIYGSGSPNLNIYNSIIWGNAAPIYHQLRGENILESSIVEDSNPEGSNLDGSDTDNTPLFREAITSDDAPTYSGDFRLWGQSPLIDMGDSAHTTSNTDFRQFDRIVEDTPDLGPYEYDGPTLTGVTPSDMTIEIDYTLAGSATRFIRHQNYFSSSSSMLYEHSSPDVIETTYLNTFNTRLSPVGSGGDTVTTTFISQNATTEDACYVSFAVTLQDTYIFEEFRADAGLDTDGLDDLSDLSGNDIANVLQYSYGAAADDIDIPVADFDNASAGRPIMVSDGDSVSYTFAQPDNLQNAGLAIDLLYSTDLSTWTTASSAVLTNLTQESISDGNGYTIYRYTFDAGTAPQYLRLAVEYYRHFVAME